jgi:xanthine dehydrogenase YagR molybdenum-binding subunit
MSARRFFPDLARRIDAREEVRGLAFSAANDAWSDPGHAMPAVAAIARGHVIAIDTRAARVFPGVQLVLTHHDLPYLKPSGFVPAEAYASQSFQPMLGPQIADRGQPIALVVADTLEAAVAGASLVRATYGAEPVTVEVDGPDAEAMVQSGVPIPPISIGEGFVQESSLDMQTVLAAVAARRLGQAVKIVDAASTGFRAA